MPIPPFMYGTAWKEEQTERLTLLAVTKGFKAIDTANQPRHYNEPLVGRALEALATKGIARDQLFLQTKFTPPGGQDDRIPYNPNDTYEEQVAQSFARSLEHLGTNYLDAYLLHGPYTRSGLSDADRRVWRSMEKLHCDKSAHMIGISNVSLHQLTLLWDFAEIKPTIVQNRCFAVQGWDRGVRGFCREHGLTYQGFSLLTANPQVLTHPVTRGLAADLGKTAAQVVFCFARQVGMVPLTGTTDPQHMEEDLDALQFHLEEEDLSRLESLLG